jgi:enoyl-CoA hydratase
MSQSEILFQHIANAGVITLNKPKTLNAVTYSMVKRLQAQLIEWEHDPSIKQVIIKAAPGRAFSAGGDIRDLYERGIAGNPHLQFFWDEYRLNAYIKSYPKPYIALIDGIVMGGGVGVSFHGSHRVAGDNISFAMPEVGIGFFPDVGGSYFLPRLPGETGLYLALTGNRIKKDDCLWSGLATHSCPSVELTALEYALCECDDVEAVLAKYQPNVPECELSRRLVDINQAFSASTLNDVFQKLMGMTSIEAKDRREWADKTLNTMRTKSPTSMEVAFRQMREGRSLTMQQCMQLEYRIVARVLSGSEFYEGIRAAIIDKDGAPNWTPNSTEAIDDDKIENIFALLPGAKGTIGGELVFK